LQGDAKAYEEETIMRNAMLAISALLVSGTAAIAGSPTPASYDYPWCVMGGELGYSGDCSYQTLEQCQASASGRWNLYCDVNIRLKFKQAAQQQQGVAPSRRHRRDY
jgi:hypothetical protein